MQRTVNLRIVVEQQTDTNPKVTSMQWTGIYLRAMNKQRMVKLRVIARLRVGDNPLAESAYPCKLSLSGYNEHAKSLPTIGEVFTIFGGPYEATAYVIDTPRKQGVHPK